ncbi:hypothetical protein DFH09DRAFT_1285290 [Mycena vulgaris]|nr:hypothetical protein DFH09DRAFT_1285290 [Mycena vulgaris]
MTAVEATYRTRVPYGLRVATGPTCPGATWRREKGRVDIRKTERVWLIWHQTNQARHTARIRSGRIMTRLLPESRSSLWRIWNANYIDKRRTTAPSLDATSSASNLPAVAIHASTPRLWSATTTMWPIPSLPDLLKADSAGVSNAILSEKVSDHTGDKYEEHKRAERERKKIRHTRTSTRFPLSHRRLSPPSLRFVPEPAGGCWRSKIEVLKLRGSKLEILELEVLQLEDLEGERNQERHNSKVRRDSFEF